MFICMPSDSYYMSIGSALKKSGIMIFLLHNRKYSDELNSVVSAAAKTGKKILFVSLSKPFATLADAFESKKIETKNIMFIDAVSGGVKKPRGYRVSFVSSPKALTELSITINESLGKETDIVIFDSLSVLLAYEDASTVTKFMHSLLSRMRERGKKCAILALSEDSENRALKDVSMFADSVIEV